MVARRHHYVPKCYLNAFAASKKGKQKPELLSFDATQRKCFRTAPDNVALEKDFNTIDLEGHPPDAFEKVLASVESDIAPALVRIVEAKSLANAEDREQLLRLIALLYTRNPRFRETIRTIGENLAKRKLEAALSSSNKWKAEVKKAQADGAIARDAVVDYDTVKQSYKAEDYALKLSNEASIVHELQAFEHALPALRERRWVLVEAPEDSPGFITCDHPVSLAWSEKPPGPGAPGLRTPNTIVFFPLTPRLAIVGTLEGENGSATFTDGEVALVNGTTVLNAQRQVYASRGDFRYQIDLSQLARPASDLVTDEQFVRPARPSVVKS
jgi:hypothetical protein